MQESMEAGALLRSLCKRQGGCLRKTCRSGGAPSKKAILLPCVSCRNRFNAMRIPACHAMLITTSLLLSALGNNATLPFAMG